MPPRKVTLGDIVRAHGPTFLASQEPSLSTQQWRVLRDIGDCRTAALGGHLQVCTNADCAQRREVYDSCNNRHCPACLAHQSKDWLQRESQLLLNVDYYHTVFTLPAQLEPLALRNKAAIYGILFRAAAETLTEIAANPKYLGAQIGFLAVLHTWSQTLMHHPHVHCVVPAGGLSFDGQRWVVPRKRRRKFFLPVRVLSRLFRGKFLAAVQEARGRGELVFPGQIAHLADDRAFGAFVRMLRAKDWVVYSKPPFNGPEQTLNYLARYTHRVAIGNARILRFEDGRVTFRYVDRKHDHAPREMTLEATEFLRRFLLHTLPKRFQRIRHYGLLANNARKTLWPRCLELAGLRVAPPVPVANDATGAPDAAAAPDELARKCPGCNQHTMIPGAELARARSWIRPTFVGYAPIKAPGVIAAARRRDTS